MRKYTKGIILFLTVLPSVYVRAEPTTSINLSLSESHNIVFQLTDSIYNSSNTMIATAHTDYYKPAGGPCGEVECNGQFAILIDGGIPPYNINLSSGQNFSTGYNYSVIDSLCAGQHIYFITDSLGQVATDTINISQTQGLTIIINHLQEVYCLGSLAGAIAADVVGGVAPYTYQIDNQPTQSSNVFDFLGAGTHNIMATDANGCSDTVPDNLAMNLSFWIDSVSTQNITCGGECLGQVTVHVNGWTGPYSYSFDNGLTYQNSNSNTNLCSGTVNVLVADTNNCLINTTINISAPPALTMSPTFTEPYCHGLSVGVVTFNASGGAPGYIYSIDDGPLTTTDPVTDIAAGEHVLHLIDANGCELNDTIIVTTPPPFSYNYFSNNPATCGFNDGSFELTAVNGNAPYLYSIDSNLTGQFQNGLFTGLPAGLYMFNVTDANGCQDSTIVALSNSNMTTQTDQNTAPLCNNNCDGIIEASPLSGSAPYNYYYNFNTTPQLTGLFTGICEGQHFITIEDGSLCLGIEEIILSQPDSITYEPIIIDPCPGNFDGEITLVNVSGGTPGHVHSLDGGFTYQASPTFSGLGAGVYQSVVQDVNGCIGYLDVLIAAPNPWNVFINKSDLNCFQDNSGFVQLIGGGATPPYTYNLNGSISAPGIFTGQYASTFPITFTDANGCTLDTSVVITEPLELILSIDSLTDPTCFAGSDGQLYLSAIGGTPYYQYSLDGGMTVTTTESFSTLAEGSYNIYIEDINGCSDNGTLLLTAPSSPIVDTANVTSIFCAGPCLGSVEINMSNSVSPYTIIPSSGNIVWITFDEYKVDSMCTGIATIDVYDNLGCYVTIDVDILSSTDLGLDTFGLLLPNCFNSCDGEISFDLSNGTPPFTISSTIGNISPITLNQYLIDSICAGNLYITATDANDCFVDETILITDPDSLYFTFNQTTIVSCTACNDGVAQLTPFGGTPPFTYNWGTLSSSTSSTANDLPGGSGIVCITDANGCQFCDSVTVDFIDDIGFDEEGFQLLVSPNPASSKIRIESSIPLMFIELFDMKGKLILAIDPLNAQVISLDIQDLPNGMYLLKSQSQEESFIEKVVIQH